MHKQVAIVGAGIFGLLIARELQLIGWRVTLYEKLPEHQHIQTSSFAAGGMIAPFSELETAEPLIHQLGLSAVELWRQIVDSLSEPVFFETKGSLIISHPRDRPHFDHLLKRIYAVASEEAMQLVDANRLEPELSSSFGQGLFLEREGHVDARSLMPALVRHIQERDGRILFGEAVSSIRPLVVETAKGTMLYDLVIDARGIGAADDIADLRAVRGEAFLVKAPLVKLSRPVRLMHPRYAVYIVPRAEDTYYIGATHIESASDAPVTLRSTLELLSAAYAVHPGFGEAVILEALHGLRPAFSDHIPKIMLEPGLIRANGLYRHGFLLSPVLAQALSLFIQDKHVAFGDRIFNFL